MSKQAQIFALILIALFVGFIIWRIQKAGDALLKKLNLKEDEEEKEIEAEEEKMTFTAFNPMFFQTAAAKKAQCLILTKTGGDRLAKDLYDSHGRVNDDEQKFVRVFKELRTKSQVSHLALFFKLNYKLDMLTFIQDYFGDEWGTTANKEYNQVIKYVAALPDYKPKA